MADSRRRTAADARRIADKAAAGKTDTEEIRGMLRRSHQRGVDEGRAQMRQELDGLDVRSTLLEVGAEHLDGIRARISGIPNSTRTEQALREAASVLRDARTLGEPPADPEPKAKAKAKKGG